jgi:ATP-dependent exoDNAse (exonuclease V) alpha subunit
MNQYLLGLQYQVLINVLKNKRSVILGGAGTGKTVVAIELCARLADEGYSVLFFARNQNLLGYLSKLLTSERVKLVHWAGFKSDLEIFEYDWVVVDEGQDLNHAELAELARISNGSKLAVFLDSNQAILNNPKQVSDRLNAQELELSINLRNTKSISRVTGYLFEGDLPETVGPEGQTPTSEVQVGELISAVKAHVLKVLQEGLRRQQLSILVDSVALRDQVLSTLNASGIPSARYLEWLSDSVTVETIDDFKGLESDYLIAVLGTLTKLSKQLSYVAASRARSRLHVIASSPDNFLVASIGEASN